MKFKSARPSWERILSEQNNVLTRAHNHIAFYVMKHNETPGRNNRGANSPYLVLWENNSSWLPYKYIGYQGGQYFFWGGGWSTMKMYLVRCEMKPMMNISLSLDAWKYSPQRMLQKALQWTAKNWENRQVLWFLSFCHWVLLAYNSLF